MQRGETVRGATGGDTLADGCSKARPSAAALAGAECSSLHRRVPQRVGASRKQSGRRPPQLQTELEYCGCHPRRNAPQGRAVAGAKPRALGAQRAAPPSTAEASQTSSPKRSLDPEDWFGRERDVRFTRHHLKPNGNQTQSTHRERHTHSLEVQTMEFTGVDLEEEGLLLGCAGERTASESPRRCSPKVDDDGVALG
jgi:hypothetical protein